MTSFPLTSSKQWLCKNENKTEKKTTKKEKKNAANPDVHVTSDWMSEESINAENLMKEGFS